MTRARQIQRILRPKGLPVLEDFAVIEAAVSDAGEGDVQIEALSCR